ncbi:DUF4160 domain-containing protein [Serratia sp. M24T3]|uniref:DUF4160 domain-containing protein n=1 Tax=Rouxiella sp. WC2420 TaxID=3234145 RepID=A0AB39VLZ0_9GAMM|nr:DUF4160 domain-containing protein [Serratia sp. M24T3]EIC85873.1 hypothetical protein SPM24T3_03647 [Serratia sp. M24T3]
MPTILRIGGFRFYFYSHEPNEPAHIHIDKGCATAKIWLHNLSIASSVGYRSHELRTIQRMVSDHRTVLQEAWDAYFM